MGIHTAAILAAAPRKAKKAHVFLTSYAILALLKALFWFFFFLTVPMFFLISDTIFNKRAHVYWFEVSRAKFLSISGVVGLALLRLKTNKKLL